MSTLQAGVAVRIETFSNVILGRTDPSFVAIVRLTLPCHRRISSFQVSRLPNCVARKPIDIILCEIPFYDCCVVLVHLWLYRMHKRLEMETFQTRATNCLRNVKSLTVPDSFVNSWKNHQRSMCRDKIELKHQRSSWFSFCLHHSDLRGTKPPEKQKEVPTWVRQKLNVVCTSCRKDSMFTLHLPWNAVKSKNLALSLGDWEGIRSPFFLPLEALAAPRQRVAILPPLRLC